MILESFSNVHDSMFLFCLCSKAGKSEGREEQGWEGAVVHH